MFILLAIFALNILPTRFAAVVMILAAFVLFALEAKFASHGVLGIGGIVTLTAGWSAAGGWTDPGDESPFLDRTGGEPAAGGNYRIFNDDCFEGTSQ